MSFPSKKKKIEVEHPTCREGQYAFDQDTVPISSRGADVKLTLCFDLPALKRIPLWESVKYHIIVSVHLGMSGGSKGQSPSL